jgi:CBS domain-containing protein
MVGASLLRFHPIEAALMVSNVMKREKSESQHFMGGYSILEGLIKKNPRGYYKWFFEPCGSHSLPIRTLKADQSLGDLLDLFKESGFGYAAIAEGGLRAMVGLTDMLRLYDDGTIKTDLVSKDVASRPFGVSAKTTLKTAIAQMFRRRVRKLVIGGRSAMVSDREVISFIFSPRQLEQTRKSPKSMLEAKVEEARPFEAEGVENLTPIRDVARRLLVSEGNTLFCERGLITPWDAVMKPWAMGRLVLS